ncbi:MAG: DEAD/DEAH box helicase family protein [Deltaproteobacteria bacterium]|nr:DEAD/DEAH box helicase family protein [Deltaproteobacteria bacterium]
MNLQQNIESEIGRKNISKIEIPEYIISNIKYDFWHWQKEALQYFLAFDDPKYEFKKSTNEPTHLMFNMATGTGKTLLMAALILYYYKKGYRHFIFFVNQNNIVDKTENNFINKSHTKYLFRQNIVIDDKIVDIRKVETFDDINDIQIKFTSIHKLHNAVYLAKENSVILEDLQKTDLVMFGDEAHHLNASTIRNGQQDFNFSAELKENSSEKDIEKSWEDTVLNKILKKGKDEQDFKNKNVLLEFTATIPTNADVVEKYRTKTIYKFELVDFLRAGYTKEINLISTSLKKKEKMLLALLFNWYRHRIALKNNIANFKPVILFRSKFIEDSKKDYEDFLSMIADLKPSDFEFLENIENKIKDDKSNSAKVYEQGKSRVKQMLAFIKDESINISEIVNFIKDEFAERNCIITNSKDNKATTKEKTTEEQEELLNSLEDKNNHMRAIFTVKRLTEGWDVLNLFDIVRLYEGRDEGSQNGQRVAGQATIQEIQLIGRGVRYFPFAYNEHDKNKRKFDEDLENPLRVLEEFYYHSDDDHRYLDELKRELKNKGFIQDNRVVKKYKLKNEFVKSDFFREIKIWKNEKIDNPERRKKTLVELKKDIEQNSRYELKSFAIKEQQVALDKDNKSDDILLESQLRDKITIPVKINEFEKNIIYKAINIKATKDLSLLRFDNLSNELNINSIDDILKEEFIGNFQINIISSKDKRNFNDLNNDEKLEILLNFFESFTKKLKDIANPYKGTEFKPFSFNKLFGIEKEKNVLIDEESQNLENDLLKHKWYVLDGFNGTEQERGLVDFLKNNIGNLEEKYDEIYLLRNEEVYKIYDFKQGRGFEPDFLLFFKGKNGNINLYYQVFIESKGGQFADNKGQFEESKEGWKEEFLKEISNKYGNGELLIYDSNNYKLIGLPFFNKQKINEFQEEFSNLIVMGDKKSDNAIIYLNSIIPDNAVPEDKKYVEYLPLYSLEAAATAFGREEYVEELGWVKAPGRKLNKDMFVAKVVGKSMEPTIPDGSYCVFRFERGGSRNETVVLVESRQVADPETNQKFTVKRYHSEKEYFSDGTWRHKRIVLSPDNNEFEPIILENVPEGGFRVVAEFLSVL